MPRGRARCAHGSRTSRAVRRRERRGCRAGRRVKEQPARSVVLDSEALSLLLRNDRSMAARIKASRQAGVPVLASPLTTVEAVQGKTDLPRLKWVLPRLRMEPVSHEDSQIAGGAASERGRAAWAHVRNRRPGRRARAPRPGPRDRSDFRPSRLVEALREARDHQKGVSTSQLLGSASALTPGAGRAPDRQRHGHIPPPGLLERLRRPGPAAGGIVSALKQIQRAESRWGEATPAGRSYDPSLPRRPAGPAEPVFGFGFPYPNSGEYLTVSKTTRSVT